MKKKIAFLTTEHFHLDDRIYYKMGKTLSREFEVAVISTLEDMSGIISDGILLMGFNGTSLTRNKKTASIINALNNYKPDIIICEENFAVYASFLYNRKSNNKASVILDVTEWYPEKVTSKKHGFQKLYAFFKHWPINIITSNLADGIIVGEELKRRRYYIIAPFKKKQIIGYYPPLQYFPYSPPVYDGKNLCFYYSGILSKNRGLYNFFRFAKEFLITHPDIQLKIIFVGKFEGPAFENDFRRMMIELNKIEFKIIEWSKYEELSGAMREADICFDLREIDFIYDNSLPIKVFEYMACGKSVVFSDIKAIRSFNNLKEYVALVNPRNAGQVVQIVTDLISNPEKLKNISAGSRKLIEDKYNWKSVEEDLINFIKTF